jgi:alpha-glucosidase
MELELDRKTNMTTENTPWWKTAVIYQIYPRSFKDTSGNGIGDIPGIIEKIPYLADTLGIDAIWISPFYPSPMKDYGYDVSDYREIHPLFGEMGDFDRLLAELHRRSIKLIIDLVPNHSSDQHAWFKESRSSRDNPKRDWYVWEDPKADGSPPNNWLSVFGGPAWELDSTTGQYYLHSFLKEQPDLNWRNPQVKEAMFNVVRYWLEKGVDGFRIDVAHFIMKDPDLRDNPLKGSTAPDIHRSLGEYDSQIHLYDKGHLDNHLVYRELRTLLDQYSQPWERVAIGEIHIFDWQEWATYYGKDLDELHLPYNFSLLAVDWDPKQVQRAVDQQESILPRGAWPTYVLGNHDESRLASRLGPENTRLAAMLLLTLRGTPTIYYGEEIGMTDGQIPPDRELDPAGLRQPGWNQGRDICRTPMQWANLPFAGFSPPGTANTWLPINSRYPEINVENQLADERSLLGLYRALLRTRKARTELQLGEYQALADQPPDCFCFIREHKNTRTLISLNFSHEPRTLQSDLLKNGSILLSSHQDREGPVRRTLELRPLEGCIVVL